MRLDLFLKKSGLIKRRQIAKEMIDAQLVMVGGKPVKPAFSLLEGMIIELKFGERTVKVKVVSLKGEVEQV